MPDMKFWGHLALLIGGIFLPTNAVAQEAAVVSEQSSGLDVLLGTKALWEMTAEQVEGQFTEMGFRWLSETSKVHGMIRPKVPLEAKSEPVVGQPKKKKMRIFNGLLEAEQVDLEFKEAKLAAVTISIWNKGDAKKLSEKEFFDRVEKLKTVVTSKLGARMQELGKNGANAAQAIIVRWETDQTEAVMEHCSDGKKGAEFHGEFIRLRFSPRQKRPLGSDGNSNVAKVNLADLAKNVKRTETNDVYVAGVPMVDQGEKGYCALATSERIFRYFGIQCDQHDMAKASESGKGGTKPAEFEEALHKLQAKFKVRVKDIITWGEKDYTKFTEAYNREAKKVGARQCPPTYFITTFTGLNPVALREARAKGGEFEKFRKAVMDSTRKGIPLLWGLELGIYPESGQKGNQTAGGHMRLIIGFNETDEQVIFSDSWGAGHELKRMKMRDAFSVTSGLYAIEPMAR